MTATRWLLLLGLFRAALAASAALLGTARSDAQVPPLAGGSATVEKRPAARAGVERGVPEALAKKRLQTSREAALAEQAIREAQATHPDAAIPDHLIRARELYTYLDLVYAQQQAAAELHAELLRRKATTEDQLETLRQIGPEEPQPYSFLLLDDLRDQLAVAQDRERSLEDEEKAAKALLASMADTHEADERRRRSAKEAAEFGRAADASSLRRESELSELRSRVTFEATNARRMEVENIELTRRVNRLRIEYLTEKVELVGKNVRFSREDLAKRIHDLDRYEANLKRDLRPLQKELARCERNWTDAKRQRDQDSRDRRVANEAVAAWQLARESQQKKISLLNQRLGEVVLLRAAWEYRYRVFNHMASGEQIEGWRQDLTGFRQRVRQQIDILNVRLADARNALSALEKRLMTEGRNDPELAGWIEEQRRHRRAMLGVYDANLVYLEAVRRVLDKVAAELNAGAMPASLSEWLTTIGQTLKTSWNYELTSIDDRPITVRKLVSGLLLLLLGIFASRSLSRTMGKRVFPWFGLNDGISTALQSISFYFLVAVFALLALEWINVPLTIFTFMGGAVAIGVGFGSQNVLSNFISGLILLAERPIRVGDLVDIDGLYGTIEQVGARSTRVRTGSNLEIIVPNSKFLESNVTNWTLSDTRNRVSVRVGVAYGSSTRDVERILREAVDRVPSVLDDPEPIVLFQDYGDNALLFEVHFWVRMRTMMQGRRAMSEVRHKMGELLGAAGVTVAFPQRDIHLDTVRPIEVRLQQPLAEAAGLPDRRAA